MADAWPEERAFRSALRDLSTSASRITSAARLALHDPAHVRAVVAALERHARDGPPAQKLPVLYVVNQICRTAAQKLGAAEPFTPAFAPRIADIVRAALADCPASDQAAAKRTVRLWVEGRLFPADLLGAFLGAAPPPPPEPKTPPGPPPPLRAPVAHAPAAAPPPPPVVHIPPHYGYAAPQQFAAGVGTGAGLYPPVAFYAPPAAPAPAPAWATYASQFDYGDEQDDEERLAEQKRRRLEEERRANESPPRSHAPPPPASAPPPALPSSPPRAPSSLPPSSLPPPSHQPQGQQFNNAPPHNAPHYAPPPGAAGGPDEGQQTFYSQTLFVGRLPPGVPRDELQRVFERFGRVTRCVVLQGKDHGFVTFAARAEAEAARQALDGVPFIPGAQAMRIGWGREGVPPHLAPYFDNNAGVATLGVAPRGRGGGGGMGGQQAWAAYDQGGR